MPQRVLAYSLARAATTTPEKAGEGREREDSMEKSEEAAQEARQRRGQARDASRCPQRRLLKPARAWENIDMCA